MRGSSELFCLPLKALVSAKEMIRVQDAPLRYATGEHKQPQMFLVLGL